MTPIFLPSAIKRGLQDRGPVIRKLKLWQYDNNGNEYGKKAIGLD